MDRLTRTRGIGPAVAWFLRSRAWRVYRHLDDRAWSRLAAAITFTSFVAFFPVLGVAVALGVAVLGRGRIDDIERWASDQVPGISQRLDLHALFDQAGTIGLISLLLVVPTGASWVDALRGCLRALWDLPDPEANPLLRRARDLGVLAGLGVVTLLSLGVSALATGAVHWAARTAGTGWPIRVAAYGFAMVVTFFLLVYLLVLLPGVRPPRRAVVAACALGAVGFELLKALLGSYLTDVATRNVYGAFGVPIALLVWMNLMAKLLLICCAWTATAVTPAERPHADAMDAKGGKGAPDGTGGTDATGAADGGGGRDTPPPRPPRDPPR
ncbi:YihY/virulence factor BrkB family protein [Streptomyces radicis]|uniref:YihY/virulence factor BrkB family protein n=1 Tax=Streptomyces radicis TaxID=1750517 RepID=A0A3A9WC67_9ACTN|nr:YihY/virulence factor BrkB family protein [Streptomyces radicis]RKN16749.1 YihY/virulence factor BrkB family protein [Streptomyces radicis]